MCIRDRIYGVTSCQTLHFHDEYTVPQTGFYFVENLLDDRTVRNCLAGYNLTVDSPDDKILPFGNG